MIVTCNSVDIQVISGMVEVAFTSTGGTSGTSTLNSGDNIIFDPENFSITNKGSTDVIITINGIPTTLSPRQTVTDSDGDGYVSIVDCNDTNSAIHPGATEIPYDGIDQDCNVTDLNDVDQDTYPSNQAVGGTPDCNDTNSAIHPGAVEILGDGIDQNCDGIDPPSTTEPMTGKLVGIQKNGNWKATGPMKIGDYSFKDSGSGTYTTSGTGKCKTLMGSGTLSDGKGNAVNLNFNGQICSKFPLIQGKVPFVITGGIGKYNGATGSGNIDLNILGNVFGADLSGKLSH